MDLNNFLHNVINDTRIELSQEFDRNFERKAFFNEKWASNRLINNRGTMMARSGALRRSIKSSAAGNQIRWTSSVPYASIQNEGGEIVVTDKMKRFFWAMYYKSSGAISKSKGGKPNPSERNQKLTVEAQQWKALALMKVGQKMKIPERRFIGDHPQVKSILQEVIDLNLVELNAYITKELKR